jgi:hypothetical protein
MLIWRIWRVEKEVERYQNNPIVQHPSHLQKVARVIAESGAVYTTMILITCISSALESNALYPTSDIVSST